MTDERERKVGLGLVDRVMAILSKANDGAYPNLAAPSSLSLSLRFSGVETTIPNFQSIRGLINGQRADKHYSYHQRHFRFTSRRDEIGVNACMVVEFRRGKRRACT